MSQQSGNKVIAKNTLFLYFRMMFTMIVSLYTSRVILQKLGIDDYGIYQSVGGIVGFLSFINGALSTGSSRFLTYALGEGNTEKLKNTFSTTLNIHIILALIVVLLAETAGYWFVCNKLVIAPDRMDAATYTFHLSILAAVFTLTQVPYNATIIAHERMSIYAYMSIVEVIAKLAICYMLSIGEFDKLKLYATLYLSVQIGLLCVYRLYCSHNFQEAKFSLKFDKKLLKEILGFSGWSLFAHCSMALNSQGILILLNMFFSPAVVAARAISIQVNMAANQFVHNFRTASNPQIVKKLAAGDISGSHSLLLSSTKYSYFLMFFLGLPICLTASNLLHLWLGVVPDYSVIFLQLIIIQSLFQVFDTSFYTALYAKGRLQENALISPVFGLIRFPIIYILFKYGCSPVVLSWASLFTYIILGLVIKPLLIVKIANYTWEEILSVFKPCVLVTIASIPLPLCISLNCDNYNIIHSLLIILSSLFSIGFSIWLLGLDEDTRYKVLTFAKQKLKITKA